MLGKTVIGSLKWVAALRILGQLVNWGATIFVIRLLSPADYGLMAFAAVFTGFIAMFSEMGLSDALVQARALTQEQMRIALGAVLLLNAAIALVLAFAVAPLAAAFLGEPRLIDILRVLSLSFVLSAFEVLPSALLARALRLKISSFVSLISGIVGSLTTLGLAFAGFGVWALVLGMVASTAARVVGLNLVAPQWLVPRFAIRQISDLVRTGTQIAATRILWFAYSQADVLIAGKILGRDLLGIYSVAMQLASMLAQRAAVVFGSVAFPAFAKANEEPAEFQRYVLLAVRMISTVSFPAFFGMFIVAPELITVVLGPTWEAAVVPFALLTLIMPIRIIMSVVSSALQAVGRADLNLQYMVVACVVMPAAFFVGCQFGLIGLALAWAIGYPLLGLWGVWRGASSLGVTLSQFLKQMARSLTCALVMVAAVAASRNAMSLSLVVSLIAMIAIGAATYAAMTWIFNRGAALELLALVRK